MLIDGLLYECYFVILIVMVVMRGCVVLDGYVYIYTYIYISGWWFGTFFIFPYVGNDHPN